MGFDWHLMCHESPEARARFSACNRRAQPAFARPKQSPAQAAGPKSRSVPARPRGRHYQRANLTRRECKISLKFRGLRNRAPDDRTFDSYNRQTRGRNRDRRASGPPREPSGLLAKRFINGIDLEAGDPELLQPPDVLVRTFQVRCRRIVERIDRRHDVDATATS